MYRSLRGASSAPSLSTQPLIPSPTRPAAAASPFPPMRAAEMYRSLRQTDTVAAAKFLAYAMVGGL